MEKIVSLPELLAPAGTFEKMNFALHYGADAVYVSGREFGMRSFAGNFSEDELFLAFQSAHKMEKKVYLTLNVMPRDRELPRLCEFLTLLSSNPPDAVIVADLGVLSLVQTYLPKTSIHISTQASTVNANGCRMWHELGAKRVVLARELSLDDIISIRANTPRDLELEVFIHGSMCVSYSGRCLLSNYFTGRDANHGACTQPCRWSYHFTEDSRPSDPLTIEEHPDGSFIIGSKDLCMIDHLSDLVKAGIKSFKIEGRMKSAYYCAAVTNAYRIRLDELAKNRSVTDSSALWRELLSVPHRPYATGFFFDDNRVDPCLVNHNGYEAENSFLTAVEREVGDRLYLCRQKNKFSPGEPVEVLTPGKTGEEFNVLEMMDENFDPIPDCPHPKMAFIIKTDKKLKPMDLIRRKSTENFV